MEKVLLLEKTETTIKKLCLELTEEQLKLLELLEKEKWFGESVICTPVSKFHRVV